MKEKSAWLAAKETRGNEHAGRVPFLAAFPHYQRAFSGARVPHTALCLR
jgi:hypothetical protein